MKMWMRIDNYRSCRRTVVVHGCALRFDVGEDGSGLLLASQALDIAYIHFERTIRTAKEYDLIT